MHHDAEHTERHEPKGRTATLLAGLGLGAAVMYFLDPGRGARRRHIVRDKGMSALRSAGDEIRDRATDLRNRVRGTAHELRQRTDGEQVSDDQLVARVRSQLGHHVDRMGTIEVDAREGTVILRGSVAHEDHDEVLSVARKVAGVQTVDDRLSIRERAGAGTQ